MLVNVRAREAHGVPYIHVDWSHRDLRWAGGGIVWKDPFFCSERDCIRQAGHMEMHNNGRGMSWVPLTDEEWEELKREKGWMV